MSDCNLWSVVVCFFLNVLIVCFNLINLFLGRCILKFSELIFNFMNVKVVVGNIVFLDLIGRLIFWVRIWNDVNVLWYLLVFGFLRKRKLLRICI